MSEAQTEESKVAEAMKVPIPMTEESNENSRKIPKVLFIEDTDAWVEKYTDDALFA